MKAFITKYLFLLIWIVAIAAIGGLFVYVLQLNSHLAPLSPTTQSVRAPQTPALPPAPSIDLTFQKGKGKNTLTVTWKNLPGDTTALNIYRGKTGTSSSTWKLWETLSIFPEDLGSGNATINLGTGSTNGYSFYVQAVQSDGNATSTLWTSGVTLPDSGTPTSTPSQIPPPPQQNNNPPPPATNPTSTQTQPPAPTSTPASNPPTPTGTPYYNPQIQISGYGAAQTGNFWVQHVDQKIQIGWQDLPASSTNIIIYRSPNQDGPWTTVLTQEDPNASGAYSIQVVDDTLGSPYYYEMNARNGTVILATYGPVYLAGQ